MLIDPERSEEFALLTPLDVRGIVRIRVAFGAIVIALLGVAAFTGYQAAYAGATHTVAWGGATIGLAPPSTGAVAIVTAECIISAVLGFALFLGLRRFFMAPIVSVRVRPDSVDFLEANGHAHRLDFRDGRARLVIDTYPRSRLEPMEGHWGYNRVVSGVGGGVCQFDDVVLDRILALAESHQVGILRARRNTMEGPAERLRLSARPSRG